MGPGQSSAAFLNVDGVAILPGGIFQFDFPPRPEGSTKGQPPFIGPHVGVTLFLRTYPRFIGVYAESNPGKGPQLIIDPHTDEGDPFGGAIRHRSYFRDDSSGLIHVKYVGRFIGWCKPATLTKLEKIAIAGARSDALVRGLDHFKVVKAPSAPPPPPGEGEGG